MAPVRVGHPIEPDEGPQSFEYKDAPLNAVPASIRQAFIVKVYSILSVQLAVTFIIASLFASLGFDWASQHQILFHLSAFGSLAVALGISCCCPQAMRTFPTNFMLLAAFTVCESVMVGFICTLYTGQSLLMAAAATAVLFLALTAYACTTKTDFTGFGPYLMAGLLALMAFGFVIFIWSLFAPVPEALIMVKAALGMVVFSFFVVYDTQLILGGNHQNQFSYDDYAFASLSLYIDIIQLFIQLLQLFGDRRQ